MVFAKVVLLWPFSSPCSVCTSKIRFLLCAGCTGQCEPHSALRSGWGAGSSGPGGGRQQVHCRDSAVQLWQVGHLSFTVSSLHHCMGSISLEHVCIVCVRVQFGLWCGESPSPLWHWAACLITWAASLLNVFNLKSACDVGSLPVHCNPGLHVSSHGQPIYWMCPCCLRSG